MDSFGYSSDGLNVKAVTLFKLVRIQRCGN